MSALAPRGIDSYRQTEIQSRSPLELVVMLYDGALRFLNLGLDAMRRGDEALNAMNPGASERRTSVEFFEVPVHTVD